MLFGALNFFSPNRFPSNRLRYKVYIYKQFNTLINKSPFYAQNSIHTSTSEMYIHLLSCTYERHKEEPSYYNIRLHKSIHISSSSNTLFRIWKENLCNPSKTFLSEFFRKYKNMHSTECLLSSHREF
jgi:hypothetical protein